MTDEQRDELNRDRMKASQPEMVTVPKELLRRLLDGLEMQAISDGLTAQETAAEIAEIRKAAGMK